MKIYIYETIEDWNAQTTDYVIDGRVDKVEHGIATIRDNDGNRQYINLDSVFCLVESMN